VTARRSAKIQLFFFIEDIIPKNCRICYTLFVSIAKNVKNIKERVAKAAERAGRDPRSIKLVAVIKNIPLDLVFRALDCGITDVGINRVQEAAEKFSIVKEKYPQLAWHMIGHLQRNKVRQALDMFDIIQSIDSERLAEEINKRAQKPVPALIEVNTSGEASKFGVSFKNAVSLVSRVASYEKIKIQGLMTIGSAANAGLEQVRSCFRALRELAQTANDLRIGNADMEILSMGMTDDFEIAIGEGSNLVRVGRGIFQQ